MPVRPSSLKTEFVYINYMVQSPSWEASGFSQEIPHILWNLKLHYRIRKISAFVPILSQINPIHPPPIFKTHYTIILPDTFI
jgi:hypothetical protein